MTALGGSEARPKVSLGLPVYNGARYLSRALDCVLAQGFCDFELVISDNASTDDTEKICRGYAERDARIRLTRNPRNLGIAANFRRVFELTTGRYFKWVVHDDEMSPTYLSCCVKQLDAAPPDVVLVYPRTTLIDESGKEIEPYDDHMDLRQARPHERLRHLLRHLRYNHCGLGLIRADVLRDTRLERGFESSDVVLLAELALRGQFWEYPERLYRRRIHPESSFGRYLSPEDYAEKMDPANRGKFPMPRTKLFVEILRAIRLAPIGDGDKLLCATMLLEVWGPRFWRVVGGEFRRRLRHEWKQLGISSRGRPGGASRP